MNIRRRGWLPLATQQLRLRNLQAIQGVNIEDSSEDSCCCSTSPTSACQCLESMVYYTLHDHPESDAFYESEKLPLRKKLTLKWAEIQCLSIVKSNANCVCIKIWLWTRNVERQRNEELLRIKEAPKSKEPIR